MMQGLIWIYCFYIFIGMADSLGCFKCTSRNRDNPACEDTFMNPDNTYFNSDCWAPMGQRNGLFPATQCLKVFIEDEYGNTNVIRDCVVDNGDLKSETEIGRLNHCLSSGQALEFNDIRGHGCVAVCDTDGCNSGNMVIVSWALIGILPILVAGFFT